MDSEDDEGEVDYFCLGNDAESVEVDYFQLDLEPDVAIVEANVKDDWLPLAVVPEIQDDMYALVDKPAKRQREDPLWPAPNHRTKADHHGICAKMREAKLVKAKATAKLQEAQQALVPVTHTDAVKQTKGLNAADVQKVAFTAPPSMSTKHMAAMFEISARSCVRLVRAGASSFILNQGWMLRNAALSCADPTVKVFFGLTSKAFDATEQKMAGSFGKQRRFRRLRWKVLVSTATVSIGVERSEPADDLTVFACRVVRPCVPLLSGATDHLHFALHKMKMWQDSNNLEMALQSSAKIFGIHYDRDGDITNDSVIANVVKEVKDIHSVAGHCQITITTMTCGNHRVQLAETTIVELFGVKFALGCMTRYALLMRMGSYWLRCSLSILPVLAQVMGPRFPQADTPKPSIYNGQFVDYILSTYIPQGKKGAKLTGDIDIDNTAADTWQTTKGGLELYRMLEDLMKMFPFPWYDGLRISEGTTLEEVGTGNSSTTTGGAKLLGVKIKQKSTLR